MVSTSTAAMSSSRWLNRVQRTAEARGWTLLEVLVVCALVGVLISSALPAYNSYMTRTRLSEALALTTSAKLVLGEACTGGYLEGATSASLGLPDSSAFADSKVVSSIEAVGSSAKQAKILVKLRTIGSLQSGDVLTLDGSCSPQSGLTWTISGSRDELTRLVN